MLILTCHVPSLCSLLFHTSRACRAMLAWSFILYLIFLARHLLPRPRLPPAHWRLTSGFLCVFDRSPEGRNHPAARAASSSRWVQSGACRQTGKVIQADLVWEAHAQLNNNPSRTLGKVKGGEFCGQCSFLGTPLLSGASLPLLCACFRLSAPGTQPSRLLPHPLTFSTPHPNLNSPPMFQLLRVLLGAF